MAGHWSAVHGPKLIEQHLSLLKANSAIEPRAKDTEAQPGATPDEEPETTTLGFTVILPPALLTKRGQESGQTVGQAAWRGSTTVNYSERPCLTLQNDSLRARLAALAERLSKLEKR